MLTPQPVEEEAVVVLQILPHKEKYTKCAKLADRTVFKSSALMK